MTEAIVLLSGGLDSTTLLYKARELYDGVEAVSFDYGQRHYRELTMARGICAALSIDHIVVGLNTALFEGSALTAKGPEVPEGHYAEESMKATIVPNRNAVMLSLAWARAVSVGARIVGYAAHAGDHFIYPDCRPEFMRAFVVMEGLATEQDIALWTPFAEVTKADIVRVGSKLSVPYNLTYSCYKGGPVHCGVCGTCTERKEAFTLAGIPDPTTYLA